MVTPMVQEIGRPGHFLPHNMALEASRAVAENAVRTVESAPSELTQHAVGAIAVKQEVVLEQSFSEAA